MAYLCPSFFLRSSTIAMFPLRHKCKPETLGTHFLARVQTRSNWLQTSVNLRSPPSPPGHETASTCDLGSLYPKVAPLKLSLITWYGLPNRLSRKNFSKLPVSVQYINPVPGWICACTLRAVAIHYHVVHVAILASKCHKDWKLPRVGILVLVYSVTQPCSLIHNDKLSFLHRLALLLAFTCSCTLGLILRYSQRLSDLVKQRILSQS
jgi:hypothetical protein